MSNRKHRRDKNQELFLILEEGNKRKIASLLGCKVEDCDVMLAKARQQGYQKVRFPNPKNPNH